MSNKVYDVLKWVAIVFLPALITFVGVVLTSLNVSNSEVVLTILTGFSTFLGSVLGISNINYKRKEG